MKDGKSDTAIYVSNDILRKDLSFYGDGTLEISFENPGDSGTGIVADDLYIGSDITITTPDCENIANGIICTSSLTLRNSAAVTVNSGSARSSTGVSVRGNAIIESGSTLAVTANPGSESACNGICVDGNLTVGKKSVLRAVIDDQFAQMSECIDVSGVMSIGTDAVVEASAKKVSAIQCSGSISVSDGASVTAATAAEKADISCYGAFVNHGAAVSGEIEALAGIHNK